MQPGYASSVLNGQSVVRFAPGKRMDIDSVLAGGTVGRSVFIVARSETTDNTVLLHMNAAQEGDAYGRQYRITPEIKARVWGVQSFGQSFPTDFSLLAVGNPENGEARDIWARLNGEPLSVSDTTHNTVLDVQGSRTSVGADWTGDMAEALVFAAELSNVNRQKVEGYLAHKWALQDTLPGDHPYRSAPPSVWVDANFTDETSGWGTTRFATIQEAMGAVASGGTVYVAAGTYVEAVPMTIDKDISIVGADKEGHHYSTGTGYRFRRRRARLDSRSGGNRIQSKPCDTGRRRAKDFSSHPLLRCRHH